MASLKNVHLATEGDGDIYEGYDDFQLDVSYRMVLCVYLVIISITRYWRRTLNFKGLLLLNKEETSGYYQQDRLLIRLLRLV